MADNWQARHILKRLNKFRTWQLLVLALLFAGVSATFLRLNNIGMTERRDAVISADASGDKQALLNRLIDLQGYVSSHMNTDLGGGVYLTNTRAKDQAEIVANSQTQANVNIYQEAVDKCSGKKSVYAVYLKCVTDYLESIPGGQVVSKTIFTSELVSRIYTHNYTSPLWSPDFAGWSVLLTAFVFVVIILRLLMLGFLHFLLRKHRNLI